MPESEILVGTALSSNVETPLTLENSTLIDPSSYKIALRPPTALDNLGTGSFIDPNSPTISPPSSSPLPPPTRQKLDPNIVERAYQDYGGALGTRHVNRDGSTTTKLSVIKPRQLAVAKDTLAYVINESGVRLDENNLSSYANTISGWDGSERTFSKAKFVGIAGLTDNLLVPYFVIDTVGGDGTRYLVPTSDYDKKPPKTNGNSSTNQDPQGSSPLTDKAIDKIKSASAADIGKAYRPPVGLPPNLATKFDPSSTFYRLIYRDDLGSFKAFVFTFLPARETKIGGWNVPEARAGLPIQTKMKHKIQVVPGAGPLVQTIGVMGTTITLIGALLGNEITEQAFNGEAGQDPSYYPATSTNNIDITADPTYSPVTGAYNKAQALTNLLVQPGRPVTVEIKPSSNQSSFGPKRVGTIAQKAGSNLIADFIQFTGVVTAVRFHHAHSDRCYYALDLFVTEYPLSPSQSTVPTGSTKPVDNTSVPASDDNASLSNPALVATQIPSVINSDIKIDLNALSQASINSESNKRVLDAPTIKDVNGARVLGGFNRAISPVSARVQREAKSIERVKALSRDGDPVTAIATALNLPLTVEQRRVLLKELQAELPELDESNQEAIAFALTRGEP